MENKMETTLHCKFQFLTLLLLEQTFISIFYSLYLSLQKRSKDFDTVRLMMIEMIDLRSKIMSGALPVDELKIIKQTLTSKIDLGNV